MECFEQTKREELKQLETELNNLLGLKEGKYGNMIHRDSAYGGNALVGYTDFDKSGVTDLTLYNVGRISDKKMIEYLRGMIEVLEYAKRFGGKL